MSTAPRQSNISGKTRRRPSEDTYSREKMIKEFEELEWKETIGKTEPKLRSELASLLRSVVIDDKIVDIFTTTTTAKERLSVFSVSRQLALNIRYLDREGDKVWRIFRSNYWKRSHYKFLSKEVIKSAYEVKRKRELDDAKKIKTDSDDEDEQVLDMLEERVFIEYASIGYNSPEELLNRSPKALKLLIDGNRITYTPRDRFGLMKLNELDADGNDQYKVFCVYPNGVQKAIDSILKKHPGAELIKEVKTNVNSFIAELKRAYSTYKIELHKNLIRLLYNTTETDLIGMIDDLYTKNIGTDRIMLSHEWKHVLTV